MVEIISLLSKTSRYGVVGILFAAILICCIYVSEKMKCSTTMDFYIKYNFEQKPENLRSAELKISKNIDKCKLEWTYRKVNRTVYETLYKMKNVHIEEYLPRRKPVKPLYPNPVIRLKPDKFLLPILYNGPNNQLTGLQEATFVAIKLNRTLVIPRFVKHFSDSSTKLHRSWYIYPGHRINIDSYCKFVSCVTIEQFKEACGRQIDGVVFLQNYKKADIRSWEQYTGMKLLPKVKGEGRHEEINIPLIPEIPIPNGRKFRKFKADEINDLFDSEERCVLYPKPLYNLHLRKRGKEKIIGTELIKKESDLKRLSEYQISMSVVKATGSPKYIKKIAKNFVSNKIKNRPFVSVHWRYNKDDFMKRCNGDISNKLKTKICENALRIKPEHIAGAIEKKIFDLSRENFHIIDVYIASPPTERKVLAGVAKILYQKNGWLTHSSLDLNEFMESEHNSCEILELHFNDIISTTEMEICGLGVAFLGSARSSWTSIVKVARRNSSERNIRPQSDEDVFSMSVAAMQDNL